MPSPFPGMNPYLEHAEVWHDFQERFMPRVADVLNAQVGPDYLVKIDEHVYVREIHEVDRRLVGRADIAVSKWRVDPVVTAGSVSLLEAPTEIMPMVVDELRECFVEIIDRHNRALVTVIELLSPSNKSGNDRQQYLAKRREVWQSPVHLVEIDLLRVGQRMPFRDPPPCDYCVMVSRAERRPTAGFWPLSIREPLPIIPVPLKNGDADARLDLQSLVSQIYDAAGYEKYIYENEISPALQSDANLSEVENVTLAKVNNTARLVVTVRPATSPDAFPEVELAGTHDGLVWLAESILRVASAESEQHTHLDAEACAPVYVSRDGWWLTISRSEQLRRARQAAASATAKGTT